MARYGAAIWKPIASDTDYGIVPVGFILHVAGSEGDSLFNWFNGPSGGIESHFYIRYDGTVEQYRDTDIDADANRWANAFTRGGVRYGFISVETEGLGSGVWTKEQLASIFRLLEWGFDKYPNIERRVCPAWDQSGVGYHVMWGAPGAWTPAVGKTCPGPARIDQFNGIIVPWLTEGTIVDKLYMTRPAWLTNAMLDDLKAAKWVTSIPAADEERELDFWQNLVFNWRILQTVQSLEERTAALERTPPGTGMTRAQLDHFDNHTHKTGRPAAMPD